jgi:hypothetical protein
VRNTKLNHVLQTFLLTAAVFCALSTLTFAQAGESQPNAGAGSIIVHSKFGGQIFGFDIDQNGTEGVLSEAQTLSNGNVLAAVETFDQTTGRILNVVAKTQTMDDFVTLGVVGRSIGLVEREHVVRLLDVVRTFHVLNPLSTNKFTGVWTPPLKTGFLIEEVSRNQGISTNAVFASGPNFNPVVFSSNVAANTFGPQISVTNQNFTSGVIPVLAYNSVTNQAVLAQDFGSPTNVPEIGLVDLTKGTTTTFRGVGFGFVNGIAVDSADGIACTTTEIDFSVEFYNLATHAGFTVTLPGATNQLFSGADVEYDPVNKLFLVAQPVSSTAASGSSIQVYDPKGNFVESINGLSFSNASNVIPAHIALNPSNRTGFVDGPSAGVTDIQSFSY